MAAANETPAPNAEVAHARKPRWLVLTFLSVLVFDQPRQQAIATTSFVEVLGRLGVSEQATRSTLSRMADRGLLERHRSRRTTYFGLTNRGTALFEEGKVAVWGSVDSNWSETWTVLGFSLPDSRRSTRHSLRARLAWAGLGLLRDGLWIAPGELDVQALVEGLDISDNIHAFTARSTDPTTIPQLIRDAYDLNEIGAAYARFVDRWQTCDQADPLVSLLLLNSEWLQLVRIDPRFPLRYLPAQWPAPQAETLYRRHSDALEPPARAAADVVLDVLALPA